MRAVVQRVSQARVEVDGRVSGQIGTGLVVLLGVAKGDTEEESVYLAEKVRRLRVFPDAAGRMNRSVVDVGGSLLVVSQFTLLADTSRGNRPGFEQAAEPQIARQLYDCFVNRCKASGTHTETGIFQAEMKLHLVNDGPVTLTLETKKSCTS
jgi:D-tyrosyl-tRNA(Tyr) deacylase